MKLSKKKKPQNNFLIQQTHLHRIVVFVATRRSIILNNTQKIEFDSLKCCLKLIPAHTAPGQLREHKQFSPHLEGENVKRGTKRLCIGSERYIEGLYRSDRDDDMMELIRTRFQVEASLQPLINFFKFCFGID